MPSTKMTGAIRRRHTSDPQNSGILWKYSDLVLRMASRSDGENGAVGFTPLSLNWRISGRQFQNSGSLWK